MALVLTRLVRSNYDELDNIPIIRQDLTTSFAKEADTYYIHAGSTTSTYTKGRMYYCDGTNLKKVVIVDELPKVNDGKLTITVNGTAHTFTANQSGNTSFSITDTNTSHSHSAGIGLVGSGNAGTSNGTYNYKAKLRSETALTVDSVAATTTSGRVYPVAVDKSGYLSVNVPWTDTDTNTHNSHAIISGTKSDNVTQIKGSASSDDIILGNSGASAGSYGNASNQEPGYGTTFNVPYITVNAKGIVTAISNKTVKIPASDNTNTATAADNILDGSNSGTQITYAPYASQQSRLSFDTSTTNPTRSDRLNLNGYLYATKFNVAGKTAIQYNTTEDCIEFIFA